MCVAFHALQPGIGMAMIVAVMSLITPRSRVLAFAEVEDGDEAGLVGCG
jgi:hypothetical protein